MWASSKASCFLVLMSLSRSKRLRWSWGLGTVGANGDFFSGGGECRIGGVEGFAGSRICVEVDINCLCIVKTVNDEKPEFQENQIPNKAGPKFPVQTAE